VSEPAGATQSGGLQYRVGDLLIDPGPQRVTRDGSVIALPKLSYDLLIALVRAAPDLVSIDAMMQEVWPKLIVSPETVSQRIKLLRDALGDDPRNPRYVEGLRGRGYRLMPSVERGIAAKEAGKSPDPADAAPIANFPPEVQSAAAPSPPASFWRRRRLWIAAAAAASIIGVFALRKIPEIGPNSAKTSVDVVAVRPRTVAVLPFENLSAEPGNQYIAVGMADAVLHQLASLPELIVIARSSSFALGNSAQDAREAGRKLGTRYLVEGSVQRAGNALRVNAQLVDTTTNHELWSLKIDRTIDDVFAVQDQIAQRVAQQLDVTFHERSAEYANLGTDAYLAFLKGRTLIGSRTVVDVEESIRQFSRAIELAPSFAAALAELAGAKILLMSLRGTPNRDNPALWPEIKTLVDRAIEIDPAAGEPYFLRAEYKLEPNGDPGGAEADFRKGLDLAPNYGSGLRLFAEYLFERKRYDEALTVIDRARLVDPLSAENHYRKGEVMRSLHNREEAAALYLQALAVKPDFYPAYTRLAQLRVNQGRTAEAIKYGERSVAIEPNVEWTRERLVWFYVDIGELSAARDVVRGFPAGSPDIPLEQALICYRAGNLEQAEALTRKGLRDPDVSDGFAMRFTTDAVVERAITMHAPAPARQFIMAIPDLKVDRGTLPVVEDNFPAVVQLATLEHFAGNREAADKLARDILEFTDHGGDVGALAGEDELTRAQASALLGNNDAALDHLEKLIRTGRRVGWWEWLGGGATFAALRTTPRFQAMVTDTHAWLQTQLQLLEQMRLQGEIPRRSATAIPGGC
jgi:TolB-like protein/DNA-binding winged helix-turn-helix (wHTH) protein/tetratricopeptide (TPR) repeat protein